jgi:galactokinase
MDSKQLRWAFVGRFGGKPGSVRLFAAPGRVNLIGEHIDYCGGFVLPAALTLDATVAVRVRPDRLLKVAATDLAEIAAISLDNLGQGRTMAWGRYQFGVAAELQEAGYPLCGADMLFHIKVPFGAGLSSSAAIELATAIALATLGQEADGLRRAIDPVKLAQIAQRAEQRYAGVQCGIMDQFAAAMGRAGQAIHLDCATLQYDYAPLELEPCCLILANTMKKHSLSESKYNQRVAETQAGLADLQRFYPERNQLCDFSSLDLAQRAEQIGDPVILRRIRHVIGENERVKEAYQALLRRDLAAFARLLNTAQDSVRHLYEVTGFELDTMAEAARSAPGCLAARMTGAGFGGCTVNVVRKDQVDRFIAWTGEQYLAKTGITPEFYPCAAGDGAREIGGRPDRPFPGLPGRSCCES